MVNIIYFIIEEINNDVAYGISKEIEIFKGRNAFKLNIKRNIMFFIKKYIK